MSGQHRSAPTKTPDAYSHEPAATIVLFVASAFIQNDLHLSLMPILVGEHVDLEPSRKAFTDTAGDFPAKFTAAIAARIAQLMIPEVFIDIPERPEDLRKSDLDALVRPAAHGPLSSSATKAGLLAELDYIRRRQQKRPPWIPRVGPDGMPLPPAQPEEVDPETPTDRPLVITALLEVGEITILLPAAAQDRPELAMAVGGLGEWESALFTVLGLVGSVPAQTITIDAAANEALVPDDVRWWSPASPPSGHAAQDPGVASELLATSATLGEHAVADSTSPAYNAVIDALASAGDWRYGPRWLLETSDPSDGASVRVIARAAIAGWADEHRSGVIVYVHGGTWHTLEGVAGDPHPLHSYLLAVTRAANGTDAVNAVSRVTLSCPGQYWCHRGGCPDVAEPEITALLTPIVAAANAAEAASNADGSDLAGSYHDFYGDHDSPRWTDAVFDQVSETLSGAGWIELERSEWEGGLEEGLLRRGEHCLLVRYDPVTRQLEIAEGRPELEIALQLLAEDGVVTGDGGGDRIDPAGVAAKHRSRDLLIAADDLLKGQILELDQQALPVQVTVLGLHPHADGSLRGPQAAALATQQLRHLFVALGLMGGT